MLWHTLLRWVGLSAAGARVGDEAVLRIDRDRRERPRLTLETRGRYGSVRLKERISLLGPPLQTRRPWLGSLRVTWTARRFGPADAPVRAMAWRGSRAEWLVGGVRLRVLGVAWIEPWVGLRRGADGRWDVRLAWRDPTLGIVSWLRVDLGVLDG